MDDDENISTLMAMGFPDIGEIKRALRMAKNDVNEAVALLTNDGGNGDVFFGPAPRPSPERNQEDVDMKDGGRENCDDDLQGFPLTNLYELETRVFQDNWSIPYKKDESLGRCLLAATKLAKEGQLDSDESCTKFLERVMPEAFRKLLTSSATTRWNLEIHEGIYDMLNLFVDLVVARLKTPPVPVGMLNILAMAFDSKNDWNTKNKERSSRRYETRESSMSSPRFSHPPRDLFSRSQYGWLCDIINMFGERGGFALIKDCFQQTLAPSEMAALLTPPANCADMLEKEEVAQRFLSPCVQKAFAAVDEMDVSELRSKEMTAVSDLLISLKLLCIQFWPQHVEDCDSKRLSIVCKMLKTPQFHSKMTALKEVSRLIDESKNSSKRNISVDRVVEWMADNSVLSVALEGNIDQVQYTDRIQAIVEFLGPRLSEEELTKIWRLAECANAHVADNVYGMMASASSKLNLKQFEHLTGLIRETWEKAAGDRLRERLLVLVGRIGKEAGQMKAKQTILELLWEISHLPELPKHLVEQALTEQLSVLTEMTFNKEATKRTYVFKCVDSIKKANKSVVISAKHLYDICKSYSKGTSAYHKPDKATLGELNKQHEIVKLLSHSLRQCQQKMSEAALRENSPLDGSTLFDGRYSQTELVDFHLDLLKFLLKEGDLYLSWTRCEELWETLVDSKHSLESDKDKAFIWFETCLTDLEATTQEKFFEKKLLSLQPGNMTHSGFKCFKAYFESVNVNNQALRRGSSAQSPFIVENMSLTGLDFVWRLVTHSSSEPIAKQAIEYLLNMSFLYVGPKLKEQSAKLHKKFIGQCYRRLEDILSCPEDGSARQDCAVEEGHEVETSMSNERSASKALMAISISNVSALPLNVRGPRLHQATRVLLVAERYISTIEEGFSSPRTILPHGATFHGRKLFVQVFTENKKDEFTVESHSNEFVCEVKLRVADVLKQSPENLIFRCGETELGPAKDRCLVSSVGPSERQTWMVKSTQSAVTTTFSSSSTALVLFQQPFLQPENEESGSSRDSSRSSPTSADDVRRTMIEEEERSLPGVVMASGGHVFSLLYSLAGLSDSKTIQSIRRLLHLIPTDPQVLEQLDSIGSGAASAANTSTSHGNGASAEASPNISPQRKKAAATTPVKVGKKPEEDDSCALRMESRVSDLFNSSAEGMNPFRVVYNLEVLSSRLMPTQQHEQASQEFSTRFLHAGGLSLILGVLMERNAMPVDVDYDVRQSAYLLALQLAYHLLCGQQDILSRSHRVPRLTPTTSPAMKPTPPKRSALDSSLSVVKKSPVVVSATKIVQTMSEPKFSEVVSCLIRVIWAAAAGNLQLALNIQTGGDSVKSPSASSDVSNKNLPIQQSHSARFYLGRRRSRGSSTGSSGSDGSNSTTTENSSGLHAGVCSQQQSGGVGSGDAQIAGEAFDLLVTCLQMRTTHITSLFRLSVLGDFIVETVLGSPSEEVRQKARDQLIRLSKLKVAARCLDLDSDSATSSPSNLTPKQQLTKLLLKTPVPLWIPACSARGITHSLLAQCTEYFDLRSSLLKGLSRREQQLLEEDAASMIEDELTFLHNFAVGGGGNARQQKLDCPLLAGHFKLVEALLTCEGVNKKLVGATLIPEVLSSFLFPASRLILEESKERTRTLKQRWSKDVNPKCDTVQSREAAYRVLVELSRCCVSNLSLVTSELVRMHHSFREDLVQQFDYSPAVERRSGGTDDTCGGFVGLKNAGATCYMNSVLQQLFCVPGVSRQLLLCSEEEEEESVFYQLQNVFGHLLESKLKYYEPERFWHCFRLFGQPVNVREQQDAFEFFMQVVDQVDEYLVSKRKSKLFAGQFQGVFSDQKICQGCPHRYEREEAFLALNLTVKSSNLQESLDQFVKGELLDGDNAYHCEKCKVKRNTIKRMCIRTLPSTLVIQLKRFHYDWETNRALKFDDFFQFPWTLDMAPYTTEGIRAREEGGKVFQQHTYTLVGVVVHSGQASAGHYYSYIKERSSGRWFKFNDTSVEAFDMTDESLASECFGGYYKVKKENSYSSSNLPEKRQRYWNAYILFYEAVSPVPSKPVTRKTISYSSQSQLSGGATFTASVTTNRSTAISASPVSTSRSSEPPLMPSSSSAARESLSQLSDLLERGEQTGLFSSRRMPASIERTIQEENLHFLENRDVFCVEYYSFIRELIGCNSASHSVAPGSKTLISDYDQLCECSVKLAVNFLCHTYFHLAKRESAVMEEIRDGISSLIACSRRSSDWLLNFLSSDGLQLVRPFLLECPTRDVRVNFASLINHSFHSYDIHHGDTETDHINRVLSAIVTLIEKDVPNNSKNSGQFFWLLSKFAQMGSRQSYQLFQLNVFSKVIRFLLGIEVDPGEDFDPKKHRRRWSSMQTKEFGELHSLLSYLILSCDTKGRKNTNKGAVSSPEPPLAIPVTVSQLLHGPVAPVFVREAVSACREVQGSVDPLTDMLCAIAYSEEDVTNTLMEEVMYQYNTVNSGELKNLSTLLLELLILPDELQAKRIKFAVEGGPSLPKIEGLLQLVRNNHDDDSCRAYQCIKTLVNASNKSTAVKEYLLHEPEQWQWSVNWLKERMSDSWESTSTAKTGQATSSAYGGAAATNQSYWNSPPPRSSTSLGVTNITSNMEEVLSNEDPTTRTFHRTTSAQVTLDEAKALLAEFGEVNEEEEEQMETEVNACS